MDATSSPMATDRWGSEVLDDVFRALASTPELSNRLIYKGARVLRRRLGENLRASFDIDANLASIAANANIAASEDSRQELREVIHRTVVNYFESQSIVRYELKKSEISPRRKSGPHPRGWDIYWLDLDVRDLRSASSPLLAPLRIDIAAPEKMSSNSVAPLEIDGHEVSAISLERIAGEKLRAFLTSLPAYCRKIGESTGVARRVKDLYDLAWIVRKRPTIVDEFWVIVGQEFHLACESRFVDCHGFSDFIEDWENTSQVFESDKTLPLDVSLKECRLALEHIVGTLERNKSIPIEFVLPPIPANST